MKALPGTLDGGGAPFATTHWSVVAACCPDTAPSAAVQEALTRLCRDYWPPLYSFVRRRGHNAHDAQDLVQGFFVHLLETQAYTRADRAKGKFRSFLLASLKNFLADRWDHEHRLRRGGGHQFVLLEEELDAVENSYAHEPEEGPWSDAERLFERRWASALVGRAMRRLESEFADNPQKARVFAELKGYLTGGTNLPTQDDIAARLGVPAVTLRSHLARLRTHYRAILREEVARTVSHVDDVDGELRHLARVLVGR